MVPENTTFLGDDLYCKQPFCEQLIQMQKHFILVCKPDSHKTLYGWVDDFERLGKIENIIINESKGKKKVKKHYRFVNQVPLRDTDDALFVNWCELTITNDKNKIIYCNAFATEPYFLGCCCISCPSFSMRLALRSEIPAFAADFTWELFLR